MRRVIVGFSGGVTSAWCAGWALQVFPKEEVVLLFHDTREEDEDTYRFLHEMAAALNHPITERSDGRSVTELARDENCLPNNRMAFCSRILKVEQGERFVKELRVAGVQEIIKVFGFSGHEWQRIQRLSMHAESAGWSVRFPLKELGVTKQQAADWCVSLGVRPPRMYEWSDHANCVGCVRGGKGYWLAVKKNRPDVFEQRKRLEKEFGHPIIKGCFLEDLETQGLKRTVNRREAIEIGPCECGT